MTTLTIEWETTVIEKHRIVIDPDHDGVPEGFATIEQMGLAALAAEDVPQADVDQLQKWLAERELTSTLQLPASTVEEIADRTITATKITQPAKDAA